MQKCQTERTALPRGGADSMQEKTTLSSTSNVSVPPLWSMEFRAHPAALTAVSEGDSTPSDIPSNEKMSNKVSFHGNLIERGKLWLEIIQQSLRG